MLGFGAALAKMASGGMGPDELAKLLRAAGIDLEMAPVPFSEASGSFTETARAVRVPGATLHRMRGRMKNGAQLEALIVLVPASIEAENPTKEVLAIGPLVTV